MSSICSEFIFFHVLKVAGKGVLPEGHERESVLCLLQLLVCWQSLVLFDS